MYRRAKFVEILLEIREEMAHEADYDVDLFAELARSGRSSTDQGELKKLVDAPAVALDGPGPDALRLSRDAVG